LTDVYNASVNYDIPSTHKNNLHMVLYKMDWLTLRLVTQHLARRLWLNLTVDTMGILWKIFLPETFSCVEPLDQKLRSQIQGSYRLKLACRFTKCFLNLRHLVWDCVWLYELSPYSIRFSVHPALCESACKFQPIFTCRLEIQDSRQGRT
jgi:hypothetical protein